LNYCGTSSWWKCPAYIYIGREIAELVTVHRVDARQRNFRFIDEQLDNRLAENEYNHGNWHLRSNGQLPKAKWHNSWGDI
jgi:hypothetical protein